MKTRDKYVEEEDAEDGPNNQQMKTKEEIYRCIGERIQVIRVTNAR